MYSVVFLLKNKRRRVLPASQLDGAMMADVPRSDGQSPREKEGRVAPVMLQNHWLSDSNPGSPNLSSIPLSWDLGDSASVRTYVHTYIGRYCAQIPLK